MGMKAMWIKAVIVAGLGIAIALYSSHKAHEPEEKDTGINRLPDDILCSIVSRLTAIEASQTSVLSKRWRNIRILNPEFKFDCFPTLDSSQVIHERLNVEQKERFFRAIDQSLALYSGQKLKSCLVRCCFLHDQIFHLGEWIADLAKVEVEELYLGHDCSMFVDEQSDRAVRFPFKLLGALSRLSHLDLSYCIVETNFVSQHNTLTWLNLNNVRLPDQQLDDILIHFPNLRKLEIILCELPDSIRISGPKLKLRCFVLWGLGSMDRVEVSNLNIVSLSISFPGDVQIFVSSVLRLERLHLSNRRMDYYFEDMPQLKHLFIQTEIQIRLPPKFRLVFGNIRVLYLLVGVYRSRASREVDLWNFAPVLSGCPCLEEFYLTVGGRLREEEGMAARWPVLQHQLLTHMELSGFSNRQNELEFARFILSSAKVLKSFVLRLARRRYYQDRLYFDRGMDLEDIMDADSVCAALQGHALSMLARVELL